MKIFYFIFMFVGLAGVLFSPGGFTKIDFMIITWSCIILVTILNK